MFLFILGIILGIAALIGGGIWLKDFLKKPFMWFIYTVVVAIVIAIPVALSFIVVLDPGYIGVSYDLSGNSKELVVGYNMVAPWCRKYTWDGTNKTITFTEGEAEDDIYGAQTKEKDYIVAVAKITVAIDSARMPEYVTSYGTSKIDSDRIVSILKSETRRAIEDAISEYTTAYVMENKSTIAAKARENVFNYLSNQPFKISTFSIEDLQAPESYENAIRAQAETRMQKENAVLQQQLNEQQALANKIKAEGEAAVLETNANAQARVREIEAETAANVAKIEAENAAEVAKINAEAEASVKATQVDAEAKAIETKANAEAKATIATGEAEAAAISAQGEAYAKNPKLMEIEIKEIEAEVQKSWAEKWSGYNFEVIGGFTFADLTDLLKGLIPTNVGIMANNVTE